MERVTTESRAGGESDLIFFRKFKRFFVWEKNFFSSASFPTPNLSNSNLRPVYSLAPSAPLLSLNPPRPDLDYTSSRL